MVVKKITLPEKYSASGYSVWDVRRTIREAESVARWNPWLAHAWMEEARNELSLEKPFFKEFDAAAERINARWAYMSKLRWFDPIEFWMYGKELRDPEYIPLSSEFYI